jgi:hypothetical protein
MVCSLALMMCPSWVHTIARMNPTGGTSTGGVAPVGSKILTAWSQATATRSPRGDQ